MIEGLFVLTVVLAIIALLGHGLWIVGASVLRSLGAIGGASPSETKHGEACPRCGLPRSGPSCRACDWPIAAIAAQRRPQAALDALAQLLAKTSSAGVIPAQTAERMLQVIAQERAKTDLAAAQAVSKVGPAAGVLPDPVVLADAVIAAEAVDEPTAHAPHAAARERGFASQVPLRQRVERFSAPEPAPAVSETRFAPPPVAAPRRNWGDWLSAFMEERNIRWGELVGGLLIVCSSIALVISFWSTIAERPLLKFLLFNGVTAGLFGVGFYCEHRWRLRTTSQGLLTIGSLLVPLNFLAIAAFTTASAANNPLTLGGELFSVLLFSTLLYFGGRVLVGGDSVALACGVIVPSLAQLLVRRFVDPQSAPPLLWGMAALPLGCYWLVNGWSLARAGARPVLAEEQTNALFKFLGITSFAALLPLALLLFKTEQPLAALHELSVAVSLLGAVPLAVGLLVWQRLAGGEQSGLRTAGASVAIFGALLSLAGLVVGWPEPVSMLPTALVEFAVFTFVAWRTRMPAGHLLAAACLAVSYLLGVYLFDGRIAWRGQSALALADTIVSGQTGALLPPLVVAYAAAAFLWMRRAGREPSMLASTGGALGLATIGLAAISTALVSWFGFGQHGDPVGAAWVYLVYAVGAIAFAARDRRPAVAWMAAALLGATVVQGLMYRYGEMLEVHPIEVPALLLYGSLCTAIAWAAGRARLAIDASPLTRVLWHATLATSLAAAAWLVWLAPRETALYLAACWLWLDLVWVALALSARWLPVWALAKVGLAAATVFGVASDLEERSWFIQSPHPWLDPWTLQAIGTALAALAILWTALRIASRRILQSRLPGDAVAGETLVDSPWLATDRALVGALVALVLSLGTYAAVPGVIQELSPRAGTVAAVASDSQVNIVASAAGDPVARVVPSTSQFEVPGISHDHAGQWGAWVLLGAVLAAVAAMAFEQRSATWLLVLIVASATVCPLVACQFENETAVASALRWASAAFLLCGSLPIWMRNQIAPLAARWLRPADLASRRFATEATTTVLITGLIPPAAMFVSLAVAALTRLPQLAISPDWYGLVGLASFAAIVAAALLIVAERSYKAIEREARPHWPKTGAALVLGAAPILAIALDQVGVALSSSPILGPEPGSAFDRLGLAASYGLPILLTALVLVGYAWRERSSAFALAGGLALNLAATTGYLLTPAAGGVVTYEPQWIRLAQLNASVAACYALIWLAALYFARRKRGEQGPIEADFLLATQAVLGTALLMLLLGGWWTALFVFPTGDVRQPQVMPAELADAWGWISLILAAAASTASSWLAGRRITMAGVFAALVSLAVMAAAVAARWDIGDWVAYNTLFTAHALIAVALLGVAWRVRRASSFWIDLARTIVFVLAVREWLDNAWWTSAGFAVLAATGAAEAWLFQRRRNLYDAALMVNLAGSIAWIESKVLDGFENFIFVNVILLALPVVPWLLIENLRIRHRQFRPDYQGEPMHRTATRLAILALGLLAAVGLLADAQQARVLDIAPWMPWTALAVVAVAAVACLWDERAVDSIARLYVLGLVAVAILVDAFNLTPPWLLWTGNMVLAAYALATSYLWSRHEGLRSLAARLRVPVVAEHELAGLAWLVPCNLLLVAAVVVLTGIVELTEREIGLRVLAAQATLVQVASVALIARGDRRGVLQTIALALGAVAAAMFGWSWLDPATSGTLLHSLVVMAASLAAVAVLYGLGLGKLLAETSDWLAPAKRLTNGLAAVVALSIAAILAVEIYQFGTWGAVEIAWPAVLAVGLTLVGLAAAALAAAVLPGRDPLNLSERGRTLYVYGAEVLLTLAFVHIRLTMPWLFGGFFQRYWPLVVMAIAFLGVGFAEVCRRYRQNVLAEPIENTGALLPVLPVLGFWATEMPVDYSLLLVLVGVLYAGLSIARRSFGFGVLAALAANGGLWYFLNRQDGFGFLAHPQIWLIPPALCVLGAAYLNRKQLSEAQMTAVRYFTSMSVYLSSTGDIFLNGVAQAPWLPAVLAGLSIVGILAGIALRVRAFLMLGTGFLALSLFTVIWYAAVDLDQTWIWWASGLVAGVLIIALFAIFEKKQQEVLAAFERIKQWQG